MMLDTVEIIVNYVEQGVVRQQLQDKLQKPELVLDANKKYWKRTEGNYGKQWRCTVTSNEIKFFGSVPKEIYGTNMKNADQGQTCSYFLDMSQDLGLDVGIGVASKIDIAHNLEMSEPPIRYYPYLGTPKGFKMLKKETTLDLIGRRGNNVRNIFYDKIVEQHDKRRRLIPFDMQGKQWLRFETRLTKPNSVGKAIGVNRPRLVDCLDAGGWDALFEMWKWQYNNIPKQNNIDYMVKDTNRITPRNAERGLLISLLSFIGEEHLEQYAELLRAKHLWGQDSIGYNNKSKFIKDLRNDIKQYRNDHDYIQELNQAIETVECR